MKIGGKFQSIFAGKKRIIKFVVIAAVLPLGVLIPILSFESYNGSQTSAQTSSTDQQFQTRVNKYKEDLKEELTSERRQLIVDECEGSQIRIAQLSTKFQKVKIDRVSRLVRLSGKFKTISEKIQNQDLNTLVTDYEATTNSFNEDAANFNTTLGDMLKIDCVTDPLAYASALSNARVQLEDLHIEASEIRVQIEEIRGKLGEIKAELN